MLGSRAHLRVTLGPGELDVLQRRVQDLARLLVDERDAQPGKLQREDELRHLGGDRAGG